MRSFSSVIRRYLKGENYYTHANIVLHDAKLIYFPIPKVACSSIKKIFADRLGLHYDLNDIDDSVHDLSFPYVVRRQIPTRRYEDYLKFAFVRHPWDRLHSCYRSKVMPDAYSTSIRGFTEGVFDGFVKFGCFTAGMSFQAFVEALHAIPDSDADEHFRSQYITLVDDEGQFLPNFIGRMESIDTDWQRVQERLGPDALLPRLMQSSGAATRFQACYNDRLVQLVAERYAKDIQLFDYTYDSPA